MHIQSTPREGPTIEVDQEMDEPIIKYMKTKKHKMK
jgi:hypothetical protein